MRKLFERTVRTAVALELVDLAVQAVDGTKVVANASVNRSYDAEGLRGLLSRLEKAIADLEAQNEGGEESAVARLPEELADKEVLREQVRQAMADLASQKRHKRINLTDADARLMKGRQGIVAGYNAQAMVSPVKTNEGGTGMLVTAVDVVDQANDNAMLVPMVEQAEETTGTKVPMTLADAGYFAASHLAECVHRGQQVVVSESRQRFLSDPYHKDQFTYDEQSDSFTCPQGQTLEFVRVQHANGVPLRLYRASGALCQACPAFGVCTSSSAILNCWVKRFQLDARVIGSEAPVHSHHVPVALVLPGVNFPAQRLLIRNPAVQALPGQHSDFNLGHIQPTPMLGGVVNLQTFGDTPRFHRLERLV